MRSNIKAKNNQKILKQFLGLLKNIDGIPILQGPLRGMRLPTNTAIKNSRMLFGNYEVDLVNQIINFPYTVNVAYDIGAHVGYMTLALSKLAQRFDGKVLAFEPHPENAQGIDGLRSINNLRGKIKLMKLALCDKVGDQNLILGPSAYMHKVEGVGLGECEDHYPRMNVSGSTVDHLVFIEGCPKPDIVKIDVEGAEVLVLEGGLVTIKRYSPALFIEVHGLNNARKVWDLMNELQYFCQHISKNGKIPISNLEKCLSLFSKESWTHHFLFTKSS